MSKITKKQLKAIKDSEQQAKKNVAKMPFFPQPKAKNIIRRPQGR